MHLKKFICALAIGLLAIALGGVAGAGLDWGAQQEAQLDSQSQSNFGVGKPVASSSTTSVDAPTATNDPTSLVTLAQGLKANVVTASAAPNIDMMALWPDDAHPTHIIA